VNAEGVGQLAGPGAGENVLSKTECLLLPIKEEEEKKT